MGALFSLGLKMRKLALLMICLVAPFTWANTLNDIRFSELPGERFEVRMTFSSAPQEPVGYTIERPARIVLDFPEVVSELKARRYPLSFDNGQSAMVLTTEGRTRLILNLNDLTSYTSRAEGNMYIVEVGASDGGYAANATVGGVNIPTAHSPDAVTPAQGPSITNIDFRRGTAGEGRIIIALSDANVSAEMTATATGVKLSFNNVWMPPELRRRLDVVDFATPVSLVTASLAGDNATLDIAASGDYDYLAYQADNEYVLSKIGRASCR